MDSKLATTSLLKKGYLDLPIPEGIDLVSEIKRLKKDKIIFTAGDHDQRLFFVIEGEVGIVKEGRVVETIASGQYFGELSLLNKIPRVASAYVISDWARVIILPEKKMRQLLQEDNRIAMNFLKKMAQKLQVI